MLTTNAIYELRDFIPLIQPKFNTITYGYNTIRYQCSKIWNNLSNNLKMSNGLSSFKKSIQKWSGPECHCGYCMHFGTYIIPLYILSFLFIHNHIGKKLFLACVFCYFKTDIKYSLFLFLFYSFSYNSEKVHFLRQAHMHYFPFFSTFIL